MCTVLEYNINVVFCVFVNKNYIPCLHYLHLFLLLTLIKAVHLVVDLRTKTRFIVIKSASILSQPNGDFCVPAVSRYSSCEGRYNPRYTRGDTFHPLELTCFYEQKFVK